MLVAASSVWAVRRGHDPAAEPVTFPEQRPVLTPERQSVGLGWGMQDALTYLQTAHAQHLAVQDAQHRRERESVIRRAYLQGFDDATSGRPNKYMDVRVSVGDARLMRPSELLSFVTHEGVTIHEDWCPAMTADERGKPRACMCYFGAHTSG